MSLQLEALLPERPVTTTNVKDICAILCHLPASLPEAFDQALSRITDKRYGSIPFKLVTAAKRPLTLDEFQLALTVVPGDTDWDESKLPSDPLTVVHCCGGSLLEVDEESQTVHFIHHSAMVHLVSKSSRLDTRTLHFKLDEADTYMGAVCVTFLNCEIPDQRISQRPQFISGVETTQKILDSSFRSSQLWAHVARHIGLRPKGKLAADLDIGTMLYGIRPQPPHQSLSKCLFSYAHTHWLEQTSFFHPDMSTVWDLLTRILKGGLEHVELPWNPTTMAGFLDWAFNHKHHALIIYYLREESVLRQGDLIDLNRRLWPGSWQLEPNSAWFNDALARVICAFQSDLQEAPFHFLLQVGADPNVPHSELDRTPLELIVDKIPEASRTELSDHRSSHHRFLCQFLSQPLVLQSLRGPVSSTLLAETLRKGFLDAALLMARHLGVEAPIHQDRDSSLAIAVDRGQALLVGELLNCGFSPVASRLQDITALELALDRHDGDMFVSLLRWTERNAAYAFDAMRLHGSFGLLHRAVVSGQPKMLEHMLKRGFNPSVKWPMDMATTTYETPIVAAIRLNRLKELGLLVKHYLAAHRYVLRAPVAPDVSALGQGDRQLIKTFLQANGASLVVDHGTSVTVALIACRHLCSIWRTPREGTAVPRAVLLASLKWIQSPQELDLLDRHGNALLNYAVSCRESVLIDVILQMGANPNVTSARGETPLLQAMLAYSTSLSSTLLHNVIRPLLQHGAKASTTVCSSTSVMSMAVRCQSTEVLETLLQFGGDPNERLQGSTATQTLLNIAMEAQNNEAVRLLMQYGARDERTNWAAGEGGTRRRRQSG